MDAQEFIEKQKTFPMHRNAWVRKQLLEKYGTCTKVVHHRGWSQDGISSPYTYSNDPPHWERCCDLIEKVLMVIYGKPAYGNLYTNEYNNQVRPAEILSVIDEIQVYLPEVAEALQNTLRG